MSEGKEQLEKTAEVLRLHLTEGLGIRPIARKLSMSRKTVRRILGKAAKKSAPPPRTSMLSPFEDHLGEWLKETPDMRAPAVLEKLRPLGYTGAASYVTDNTVRRQAHPHWGAGGSRGQRPQAPFGVLPAVRRGPLEPGRAGPFALPPHGAPAGAGPRAAHP